MRSAAVRAALPGTAGAGLVAAGFPAGTGFAAGAGFAACAGCGAAGLGAGFAAGTGFAAGAVLGACAGVGAVWASAPPAAQAMARTMPISRMAGSLMDHTVRPSLAQTDSIANLCCRLLRLTGASVRRLMGAKILRKVPDADAG